MEINDLVKKLEGLKLPEIELLGHKHQLRYFLLSRYQKAQKQAFVLDLFLKAAPVGFALIALVLVFSNSSLFPLPSAALAKEIAMQDPRVTALMEQGAIIKETQLADSRGYIMIQETASVFLVEVDFKTKKVGNFKETILTPSALSQSEKMRIQDISEQSEAVKKEIPEEAGIREIRSSMPQPKLIKKGGEIEVFPAREAMIIYRNNGNQWQTTVDLGAGRVKEIEFIGENR